MKANAFNQHHQIMNKRILAHMAQLEDLTGKMFHEYDKLFDAVCKDALDSENLNIKLLTIERLAKRIDRLTMDGQDET